MYICNMFSLHNNVETAHNRGCHLEGRKVSVFNRLELYCRQKERATVALLL